MSNGTIDWTLGLRVKVTTLLDNVIIGTIYSFCQVTNTLALIEESSTDDTSKVDQNDKSKLNGNGNKSKKAQPNYRIIKTSFIKEAVALEKPRKSGATPSAASVVAGTPHRDAFAKAEPPIGPIQVSLLAGKAQTAVKAQKEKLAKIGVGVTKEAQELFDLISKTVPCRWYGKVIIAMDEVRIDPPYTSSSCLADDSNSAALKFVKRLVEGSREKMSKNEVKGG